MSINKLKNAILFASILFVGASCQDTDDFLSSKDKNGQSGTEKTDFFDFSTIRHVDLVVDYSVRDTHGPVRFSVYNRNPILNEGDVDEVLDETIEPIFTGYTDKYGRFDATVSLPAYAKVLHVVTGDFTIGLKRGLAEVVNGVAKFTLEDPVYAGSRPLTRAVGTGVQTNDITRLHNVYNKINTSSGAATSQLYKPWYTPLGTWDSMSGYPSYIMDKSTAKPELSFADEDMDVLYEAVKAALNSGTTCKESYRAASDLQLIKDSEVSICVLGSMTCWTNSMGYYYYNDSNVPTKPQDLNIIMLFPNTQDGERYPGCNTQNNVGINRGDVVQLMYYPNIANGDFSGATTFFPKGTRIGFILKAHGWGTQDTSNDYSVYSSDTKVMNKRMNVWGASTEGLSYESLSGAKIKNPNGEARTAKFDYLSPEGKKYVITSFEDATDDSDYDDLVYALNPASAFSSLAQVENGKTSTYGVFAFEDLWPMRGDYDMNDVVVSVKNTVFFESNGTTKKQTIEMTTFENTVELKNGLAVRLNQTPSTVAMSKKLPGESDFTTVNFEKYTDSKTGKAVYNLTEHIAPEVGSTYRLELTYSKAKDAKDISEVLKVVEPFVWRTQDDGSQLEIHIPYGQPTSKMDMGLFGREDDRSNIDEGAYYVRSGLYPFSFYLSGSKAEDFYDTILNGNDHQTIDAFYPLFLTWSRTKGLEHPDWYLQFNK